jgi:PAS domain S-box-containing protein
VNARPTGDPAAGPAVPPPSPTSTSAPATAPHTASASAADALLQAHAAELERRVAERTAELRRREEQLRLITDSIPALVAYVDHQRRYRYANRGYRDWFGLDLDRPAAISARGFLGEETFAAIRPQVSRAFAGEAVTFEYDITRLDGSVVRVRTSLVPDVADDGQIAGCFELTFDITEQLRAQELLLKAQQMEALGQLTGGLAHDFNNLLTVVVGNLGRLLRERGDIPEVREYAEPALQAAGRGVDLLRRLLSFARRQPLKPGAVDVAQVVASVTRIVTRTLPETLELDLQVGRQPLWAWLDASELENALLNLLLNARDAVAVLGTGRVQVRTEARRLDAAAAGALGLSPPAEGQPVRCVRLTVRDDGCGMDAATLRRVYEPFFTTKPPGRGSGLGLAMVYGFVRQSRGAIEIDSQPGLGTAVHLWLPACDAPPPEAAFDDPAPPGDEAMSAGGPPGPGTPAGADGGCGLALLVEDEDSVREVVRRHLLDLGWAVLEAADGAEARAILCHTPGIGLLLSDVVMPGGIDGRTLAREARTLHQVPRVLLMSGHVPERPERPEDAPPATRGHADSAHGSHSSHGSEPPAPLLLKPFTQAQLARALAAAGPPCAVDEASR